MAANNAVRSVTDTEVVQWTSPHSLIIYKWPNLYANYLIDIHTSLIDMQIIWYSYGLDRNAIDLIIMQITLV